MRITYNIDQQIYIMLLYPVFTMAGNGPILLLIATKKKDAKSNIEKDSRNVDDCLQQHLRQQSRRSIAV